MIKMLSKVKYVFLWFKEFIKGIVFFSNFGIMSNKKEWSLNKILGLREYSDISEILNYIKNNDGTQDFSEKKYLRFAETNNFKLWFIVSKSHAFIVRDDGYETKVILKRKKELFRFHLIRENDQPRLYIDYTITSLPINSGFTGSINGFKETLKKLLDRENE